MAAHDGRPVVTIAEHARPGPLRQGPAGPARPHLRRRARARRAASCPAVRAPGARRRTRCCSTGSPRSRPAAPGSRACAPARSCSHGRRARPGQAGHDPLGVDRASCATAPDVTVLENVRYVRDGNLVTSAGVSRRDRHGALARRPALRRSSTPGSPSTPWSTTRRRPTPPWSEPDPARRSASGPQAGRSGAPMDRIVESAREAPWTSSR